ncbi:hypothetical protein [Streptomyces sp. NPDC056452]
MTKVIGRPRVILCHLRDRESGKAVPIALVGHVLTQELTPG